MFTGIITGVGRITAVHDLGSSFHHGKRLTIQAPVGYLSDVGLGDSIALNGACMTVTSFDALTHQFTIDISAESLACTSGLTELGSVNLEKALRANDRLGGHIVWRGRFETVLTGPADEQWDAAFIAAYPNAGAFLAMVTDPDYKLAVVNRQAAVATSRLVRFAPLAIEGVKFA